MDTKTINLRNLPVELVARAKAQAASQGISLRQLVIDCLTHGLAGQTFDLPKHADMPKGVTVFDTASVAKAIRRGKPQDTKRSVDYLSMSNSEALRAMREVKHGKETA